MVVIGRECPESLRPEYADPHFEIIGFLHEHMTLGGVEPDKVTPPHLILFVIQQVNTRAPRDEVEFQLDVVVIGVPPLLKTVVPKIPLPVFWEIQCFKHDDKK